MQVLIEIPNPPKRQEIVDIPLHFIDGDVCEAGGYGFKVLSPHGRLIDGDELISDLRIYESKYCGEQGYVTQDDINNAPTILEAEREPITFYDKPIGEAKEMPTTTSAHTILESEQ